MKELKIDRDKMLKAAAESCDTVKKVFEELWPEEFEKEVHDEYGAQYDFDWCCDGSTGSTFMVCRVGPDKKILVSISDGRYYDSPGLTQQPYSDSEFKTHLAKEIKESGLKYIGNAFKGDTNA